MEIKFIKFNKGDNWVSGLVNDGEYYFESKLFDLSSHHGINNGRVSKLTIVIGDKWTNWQNVITNYDRGWDIKPKTRAEKEVYKKVLDFLENAPLLFD